MSYKSSEKAGRIEAEVSSSESLNLLYFIHRNVDPKHCHLPLNSGDFSTSHHGRKLHHS